MNVFQKIASILGGLTIGALLIYTSVNSLADSPKKNELRWVHSSDVAQVKYSVTKKSVRVMCLITYDQLCLQVNSTEDGFSALQSAIQNDVDYAIGYIQERAFFSDSPKLYNMVYAIDVNGVTVRSYEKKVRETRYLLFGLLALGILLCGYVLYLPTLWASPSINPDASDIAACSGHVKHEVTSMYRILLAARIGTVLSLVTFAILGFIAGVSLTVMLGVLSITLFTFFVDAVVSYIHPHFERQTPRNPLFAYVLKLSVLNAPTISQGYKLGMAILVAILFGANLARMLGHL